MVRVWHLLTQVLANPGPNCKMLFSLRACRSAQCDLQSGPWRDVVERENLEGYIRSYGDVDDLWMPWKVSRPIPAFFTFPWFLTCSLRRKATGVATTEPATWPVQLRLQELQNTTRAQLTRVAKVRRRPSWWRRRGCTNSDNPKLQAEPASATTVAQPI